MAISLRYWLPVATWGALIALLSTGTFDGGLTYGLVREVLLFLVPELSPQTINLVHLGVRKLAHVFEYFVFVLLLYRAFRQDSPDGRYWRWALLSVLVAVGFAGLDEIHQAFTPGRTGSVVDVGLDTVGALLAQGLVYWRHRRA